MPEEISICVEPVGTTIGADIRGFDLKSLTTAEYRFIRRAWLDHLVLRIRGQSFGDDEHVAFARMFGDLERPARVINTGRGLHAGYPEISVISNITEMGVPIGSLGDGELVWHSDMSFVERPPAASLLHALEVPRLGGDTDFLNMYAVYEDVPPELKSAIVGKSIKHENVHGSDMRVRPGVREPDSGDVRDYPGALHPIVRTHPETGRQALYLGRRCNAYILGLPIDESEELLDRLWALAERSGKVFTQKWKIGDLIIWDNRCVMHRRAGFDGAMRRRMHRVVIGGEKPFYKDGRSPVAAI